VLHPEWLLGYCDWCGQPFIGEGLLVNLLIRFLEPGWEHEGHVVLEVCWRCHKNLHLDSYSGPASEDQDS
jgi:hypothetical protein